MVFSSHAPQGAVGVLQWVPGIVLMPRTIAFNCKRGDKLRILRGGVYPGLAGAPKCHPMCAYRREAQGHGTDTPRRSHVKMEQEGGVTLRECVGPPGAGREQKDPPLEPSEEQPSPAHSVIQASGL